MATTITEQALREQYAASRLALLGISFTDAMHRQPILITLQCGAREAERASQINRAARHWTERPD